MRLTVLWDVLLLSMGVLPKHKRQDSSFFFSAAAVSGFASALLAGACGIETDVLG